MSSAECGTQNADGWTENSAIGNRQSAISRRTPIRADLVARIRREIADGTYDTEEKWHAALDRLLERL